MEATISYLLMPEKHINSNPEMHCVEVIVQKNLP